ncbi:MAG: U32 family peptidase [Lentisphaerota bacterium]
MTKPHQKKKPELLAPAGSLAAGITAIDYGADAVYGGLAKFNARERTENFTLEEMSKMIAYAHKFSKKVYLTFNTLIKESELEEAASSLFEVSKLKPDAIIVQDLGIIHLIKNYFPSLPLHASTQMGIHNSAGVNFARKLGIKRVILERQITLDEIQEIKKNSPVELEVFIHGALCCSISGSCIFSSWTGGYSGNRGKCKQPCRKPYTSEDGVTNYTLSTKDLCSIDTISAYKQLGITSLKIEGRLRKPDYIKTVVSAYRAVLDSDAPSVLSTSRQTLQGALGRKWTEGFTNRDSFKDMVEPNALGITGKECGRVIEPKNGGFRALITSFIHIGDRVRVQPLSGEEGEAFTVTEIFVNNDVAKRCTKGHYCFIKTKKEIPPNGIIYKIGESGGDMVSAITHLPALKHKVNLAISVTKTGLQVKVLNFEHLNWSDAEPISEAKNQPINKETISEAFTSAKSDIFETDKIEVSIDGKYFIPSSVLKQKRRDFWDWLIPRLDESFFFMESIKGIANFKNDYDSAKQSEKNEMIPPHKTVLLPETSQSPIEGAIISNTLDDFDAKTQEVILPEYCFEHDLQRIERKIRIAIEKGIKNFRVTSLYQFEMLLKYKGLNISTSYPLPTVNSLAVKEIKNSAVRANFSLKTVQAWIELEKEEILKFGAKSSALVEIYKYGRPILFVTRAYLSAKGLIKDKKDVGFFIKKDSKSGLCYLYGEKVLSIDGFEEFSAFYDLLNAQMDEPNTHSFNLNYTLL